MSRVRSSLKGRFVTQFLIMECDQLQRNLLYSELEDEGFVVTPDFVDGSHRDFMRNGVIVRVAETEAATMASIAPAGNAKHNPRLYMDDLLIVYMGNSINDKIISREISLEVLRQEKAIIPTGDDRLMVAHDVRQLAEINEMDLDMRLLDVFPDEVNTMRFIVQHVVMCCVQVRGASFTGLEEVSRPRLS